MDGTAVNAIVGSAAKPHAVTVGGITHILTPRTIPEGGIAWDRSGVPTPDALPEPVELGSLQGLVDLVGVEKGAGIKIARIESPNRVELLSALGPGPFFLRKRFAFAEVACGRVASGHYYEAEEFNIALQTCFVRTESVAKILKLVGNLVSENVQTAADDGVSQSVQVRAGVSGVLGKAADVPNPVSLAPFRTFPEITPPESFFVLRLRKGPTLPQCALFEVDNRTWNLAAVAAIKAWLVAKLPAEISIVA
jgi:hypothetical protein